METQKMGVISRLFVCIGYLSIFIGICWYFSGNLSFLKDANNNFNMLFVSGALLLIFGTYLAEPYFTKPLDVLTNTTAIILSLLAIRNPDNFLGYNYIFYTSVFLLVLSLITVILHAANKAHKFESILFMIVTKLGSSKVIFSVIYLLTIFSFLTNKPLALSFFLTFWVVFIVDFTTIWIVNFIRKIWEKFKQPKNLTFIGDAIGCENPFLYKVEVDFNIYTGKKIQNGDIVLFAQDSEGGIVGLVVNVKYLINKQWLFVYMLRKEDFCLGICKDTISKHKIDTHNLTKKVYLLDFNSLSESQQKEIEKNELFKNKNNFVGYVIDGSNINKIKFLPMLNEKNTNYKLLKEGTIITTNIYEQETLFQIIDGITSKETLETHNVSGYIAGVAQKLGKYDFSNKQIDSVKWIPNMYAPLFFREKKTVLAADTKLTIGYLPNTEMTIDIKDINSLITHNTAILGILGIGKSCLTFELIQKVCLNSATKIICIDITNEYPLILPEYINTDKIVADRERIFHASLEEKREYIHKSAGGSLDYTKSGNLAEYKKTIKEDLLGFIFNNNQITPEQIYTASFEQTKRVRIYNPDLHPATKGEKNGYNVNIIELTQAEKTRIICEEVFKILMKMPPSQTARILLVFEEAHSLVPEWNSTANDGDASAVNGTAKVILQGRKYGLGSFIVTQRTANISKSILNQCNTIFALRVFDDTGKTFLENYIGSDYSGLLPTLEERYAIAVGKALKLRLPVMVRLNEKNDVVLPPTIAAAEEKQSSTGAI